MRTLNSLLTASVLALGTCQKPAPTCDKDCETIVEAVAAQANATLSDPDKSHRRTVPLSDVDASCKKSVSDFVVNCMVADGSLRTPLMGDDCLNMAREKLKQCALRQYAE